MESGQAVKIGYLVPQKVLSYSEEDRLAYFSNRKNVNARIILTLSDFLVKHSKNFQRSSIVLTGTQNRLFRNGTLLGVIGDVNRSEVDIGGGNHIMNKMVTEMVDFAYPFRLSYGTFMTQKPEFKPQMFGILQTFSLWMWIAIISTVLTMSLILQFYYCTLRRKYSFDKFFLHVFAVLLRQSSLLKVSSLTEKLLIYSWVIGAMLICLAYDSVFFSFFTLPPVTTIRDVSQLARAVEKGDYNCIVLPNSGIYTELLRSQEKDLKVIAKDLRNNNLSSIDILRDFFKEKNKKNLAFISDRGSIDIYAIGKKIVSQDHFLHLMASMMLKKDFCCKHLIETFVHRFMASGLYFKYYSDSIFLRQLPANNRYRESDAGKRKLTYIDVALAFIFLLIGYIISSLVLIAEVLINFSQKKKKNSTAKKY